MKRIVNVLLIVLVITFISSCKSRNMEKVKEKFINEGYMVEVIEGDTNYKNSISTIYAGNSKIPSLENVTDEDEYFIGSLYESKNDAKAALIEIEDELGKTTYIVIDRWLVLASDEGLKIFKK